MANSYDDYQKQLASIYEQIQNRGPFQYDMNADPLYQQYKDQYVQGGKLAMKDTMGQAAGLTGGYGSTYGQQVGQQAYNAYLQNLGAQIPKLYEMAYGMYRDRGDDLLKQYNFLKANPVEAPLPEVLPAGGGGGGGGPRGGGDGGGGGSPYIDYDSINKLGMGPINADTLSKQIELGYVNENRDGNRIYYTKSTPEKDPLRDVTAGSRAFLDKYGESLNKKKKRGGGGR